MRSGTIYPDGRIVLHGFSPEKTRLVFISDRWIGIHHPGGSWSDNGGRHYGEACIDIYPLERLQRGNEEGTWLFEAGWRGGLSFHPVISRATKKAVGALLDDGDRFIERMAEREEA